MRLQQTIFEEKNVAKAKMTILLPQRFQLYSILKLLFIETFQIFVRIFSKSSAAALLHVEIV